MTDKYSLHENENILRARCDREYLGELLSNNEDLIWFSIRNYVGDPDKLAEFNGMEKEDIFQVACIGFINAVDNFDYKRGILFTTYAPAVISGEVKSYIRDKGRLIRLPRSAFDLNTEVMQYSENIYYEKFFPVEKVAEKMNEDADKVRKVTTVGMHPFYLSDDPSGECEFKRKGGINRTFAFHDIGDLDNETENSVVDEMYLDYLLEEVRNKIGERDKRILEYKLNGDTHAEIANKENISKITVTRTMNKIRDLFKDIEK